MALEKVCSNPTTIQSGGSAQYPATDFSNLTNSYEYLYENPTGDPCIALTLPSRIVGDTSNSFCIDPTHIAPLFTCYGDFANGTLPGFSSIEAGYSVNDEHPGSWQSILAGQQEIANLVNALYDQLVMGAVGLLPCLQRRFESLRPCSPRSRVFE